MTRLRTVAQSLMAEARGLTRKMPGANVIILAYDAADTSLAVVHEQESLDWDYIASKLRAAGEELRAEQRTSGAK